jgi:uncharacterized membrane protein
MSKETVKAPQVELLLAGLLRYGTGLASGVTGLGLAMLLVGVEGTQVVAAGVALFIGLPVLRVLVMLAAFILNQDYRLVIVAAVVLITILAGLVIGLSSSNPLAR